VRNVPSQHKKEEQKNDKKLWWGQQFNKMEKTDREPCPWRVVDDAGGAYVFGLIGGGIWHLGVGMKNSPAGTRWREGVARSRLRAPILGGSFAVWGTLFSICDCSFTYVRKKEDPWNAIMSGAATGGLLAARAGAKAAGRSALVGGVILAAIEGMTVFVSRVLMPKFEDDGQERIIDKLEPPRDPKRSLSTNNKFNGGRSQSIFEAAPSASSLYEGGNNLQFDNRTPNFEQHGFGADVEIKSTESKPEEPKKGWLW
jgi:import inner membrane translocase subunit TIM17